MWPLSSRQPSRQPSTAVPAGWARTARGPAAVTTPLSQPGRRNCEPHDPESALCRSHLAEYEGLSLGELERMERAQDGEARVSASDGHSDADPGL